jgi:hypothetical protein
LRSFGVRAGGVKTALEQLKTALEQLLAKQKWHVPHLTSGGSNRHRLIVYTNPPFWGTVRNPG